MSNNRTNTENEPSTREAPASNNPGQTAVAEGSSRTMTITQEAQRNEPEVLQLTLQNRSVRWDEGVVDNEGLGRKSSKRCCIFHKQRAFGESSTDSSDYESDGEGGRRRIARPKNKKIPDYQRYHA